QPTKVAPAVHISVQPTKEIVVPLCKQLPAPPTGAVSQAQGERYCKLIADAHPTLFDGKQGTFKGVVAKIHLKEGAESKMKVLPPAKGKPKGVEIQAKIEKQLDKFYETATIVDGIGLKVASQMVPVIKKKNGEFNVRLCANYKNTINPLIEDEPYNFPNINEQCEKLMGEYYTCLDITNAYPHIKMEEESKQYMTVVTDRGFAQPDRLHFGIKTAPKIFQSNIDKCLHGIPSCACIVDDICVTGKTPAEHFQNVEAVLHRLEQAGLKLNPAKCRFYVKEVKYLGRIISKNGQKMDPEVVSAISKMPTPKSCKELESFLGFLSYVRRHVPDMSRVTPILSALLKKDVKFIWKVEHEEAFQRCKRLAGNMATLGHFDETKEIVLTTDASPVGLGACLSHRIVEGNKSYLQPIAYASRSLTSAEMNYAQIEREGLAVVWAVKYFRQYLYCRHFTLQTDCSALIKIFGPKNDLGGCAIGRMSRWCVDLMEYEFTAVHINGDKNKVCDGLSRLPQPSPDNLLINDSGSGLPGRTTAEFANLTVADTPTSIVQCLSALPVSGRDAISCCKARISTLRSACAAPDSH
ncbi:unnamed protein product, partial [Meganyctiphanes norvegica]